MADTIRQIKFSADRWSKDDHLIRGNKIAKYITGVLFPVASMHERESETERPTPALCFYDDHNEMWQLGGGNNWWMRLNGNEVTLTARYETPSKALEGLGSYLEWQLTKL